MAKRGTRFVVPGQSWAHIDTGKGGSFCSAEGNYPPARRASWRLLNCPTCDALYHGHYVSPAVVQRLPLAEMYKLPRRQRDVARLLMFERGIKT